MFTTYPRGEITFDQPDEPDSSAGQRVWRCVELELMVPWLYLQVVRRFGKENYTSMLMIYHAHELKQFVDEQSDQTWLEQVQLVTPPHMNGQSGWLMEPLTMAGIVVDPRDGSHFLVYQVESGAIYSLRDDADVSLEPFSILFSAENDIRSGAAI